MNEILCEYTGVVGPCEGAGWEYPVKNYCIDPSHFGNPLKYIMSDNEQGNVYGRYVFTEEMWRVAYIANRYIKVDEQIFLESQTDILN